MDEIIKPSILSEVDQKQKNLNKQIFTVYLIVTNNILTKETKKFVCSSKTLTPHGVDFKGFELNKKQYEELLNTKLNTWNEVEEIALKNNILKKELFIPWQNVCYIENLMYKQK
jgi:hypothetical protein